MEEIFDFLNGEEIDDIKTHDEEMKEWRKKNSERLDISANGFAGYQHGTNGRGVYAIHCRQSRTDIL